jgi:hypothetical protein
MTVRVTMLVLALAASSARAGAETPGDAGTAAGTPGDLDTVDVAVGSQPQILGLRSGTIGIPSEGASSGLQALLSNQISAKGADIDALAKLGGLQLSDRLVAEIVAESFQASLPRTVLDGTPPLPKMFSTKLSDVGFRFRVRLTSGAPAALTKQGFVRCLGLRREAAAATARLMSPAELAELAARAKRSFDDFKARSGTLDQARQRAREATAAALRDPASCVAAKVADAAVAHATTDEAQARAAADADKLA